MSIEALTLLLRALGCPFFPPPLSLWHIKQNAVFGIIRFLAAMAEKREEGGRGSNHWRSRSVPPSALFRPTDPFSPGGMPAAGRMMSAKNNLLGSSSRSRLLFCKENWW